MYACMYEFKRFYVHLFACICVFVHVNPHACVFAYVYKYTCKHDLCTALKSLHGNNKEFACTYACMRVFVFSCMWGLYVSRLARMWMKIVFRTHTSTHVLMCWNHPYLFVCSMVCMFVCCDVFAMLCMCIYAHVWMDACMHLGLYIWMCVCVFVVCMHMCFCVLV